MSERQTFHNDKGEELCKWFDKIGASEEMRQSYKLFGKELELCSNFFYEINGLNFLDFMVGSKAEGTCLDKRIYGGNMTDCDRISCNTQCPIITSLDSVPADYCFLIIRDHDSNPGYVKLQHVVYGEALTSNNCSNVNDIEVRTDHKGRFCLDHNAAYEHLCIYTLRSFTRHGPAFTSRTSCYLSDLVPAFICKTVPSFANKWVNHYETCVWPSQKYIERLVRLGCLVVPAGHPQSSERDLEWRLSFSLQERDIMFSLSPVQHKCYIFLKGLKSEINEKLEDDFITSYYLKTCILNLKTLTAGTFWSEHNILICVRMCLLIILSWVYKRFCPNFFIPEQNLFEKRCRDDILRKVLYNLAFVQDPKYLKVVNRSIYQKFGSLISTISLKECMPPFPNVLCKIFDIVQCRENKRHLILKQRCTKAMTKVDFYEETLEKLNKILHLTSEYHSNHEMEHPKKVLTLLYKTELMQMCGALAWKNETWSCINFSHAIYCHEQSESNAVNETHRLLPMFNFIKAICKGEWSNDLLHQCREHHFEELGSHLNDSITSDTVFASVLYMSGRYLEADSILADIRSKTQATLPICVCKGKIAEFEHIPFEYSNSFQDFSPCVIFTMYDLPIIPEALYFELIRNRTPDTITRKYWILDSWCSMAVVDARVYLHFLGYLVNKSLQKWDDLKLAFSRFKRVVLNAEKYGSLKVDIQRSRFYQCCPGHIETARNLLGWIYVQDGRHMDVAVRCFFRSWQKIRNANAAKWHLALLLFDTL